MAKYHISEDGKPRPCRAKVTSCPKGGEESHFSGGKQDAIQWAEQKNAETMGGTFSKQNKNVTTASPITTKKALIDHVSKADLKYSGDRPQWLEEDDNTELLDVIEYDGRKIAVVNQKVSTYKVDNIPKKKGFSVSHIDLKDFDTEESIGYLKNTKVTDASLKQAFGQDDYTAFRYAAQYPTEATEGHRRAIQNYDRATTEEEKLEAKKDLWVSAHNSTAMTDFHVNKSEAPETEEELDMELSMFADMDETTTTSIRQLGQTFKEPYVDYINVKDEHKGKALGAALYVYAGKTAAKNNERLRASGVQSDDAQRSWDRMKKEFPENIVYEKNPYEKDKEYVFLDFRQK